MKALTERQQEILNFIYTHFRQNQYWPSIREIQKHFGFKSTNAVMGHLRALENKEHITRTHGQARAYQLSSTEFQFESDEAPDTSNLMEIPIYGSIAAGYPDRVEAGGEIGRLQIGAETAGLRRSNQSFALKVRGDSMVDAGIYDGDIVIVEKGHPKNGDIVAALIDGETTLKRFIQQSRRAPFLKAENQAYPELHPVSELIVQGLAKTVVRSL